MKLIIQDELSINSYDLPSSQKTFIINYENEILHLLKKEDNTWVLLASKTVSLISSGQYVEEVSLTDYSITYAELKVYNKNILVIAVPNKETYKTYAVGTIKEITIGMSQNNTIQYGVSSINEEQAKIQFAEGNFWLTPTNGAPIFLNGKKVTQTFLRMGDVIFVSGLKIIWMNNFFKINNPNNKVVINGIAETGLVHPDATQFTERTESERNTKLYNESQMFYHIPRQNSYIKEVDFPIQVPPERERLERMPLIFTIGTSIVVAASSAMTGIQAVQKLKDGIQDKFTAYMEIFLAVLMLVSCILIPILMELYQKHVSNHKERVRQKKYKAFLNKKIKEIDEIIKSQETILKENFLSLEEIEKQMANQGHAFWSREIIDEDFLSVRLGTGNVPASIKVRAELDQFNIDDDNLRDMVKDLVEKKMELKDVPISLSLLTNKITPIVNESNKMYEYINSIMLQLIFYYSAIDLKIVLITSKENEYKWDYLKYMSHNWSSDHEKRLFAVTDTEIGQLSAFLEQIYNERTTKSTEYNPESNNETRKAEFYKSYQDYYLIITDNYAAIKNNAFLNKIINGSMNLGFSLLVFSDSMKNIPSRLKKFVVIRDEVSGLYDKDMSAGDNISFKAEYTDLLNIRYYANIAANIPVSSRDIESVMPSSIGFLELYNVGKIEHLNITNRWETNDPTTSLNAPLGVQSNNRILGLDLHEKSHGPHGLIAGSTGSGKSEFIMTFILSLAINYHPYEVQFVLIDYKGGGLAGAFEKRDKGIRIPHLVGTITNLDKSEMNRTLVSIKSELERRQRKFNEARDMLDEGTIDIYKYQRLYREGKVNEPMSHLIIISDEFAELKQQQPDFMDELVSTARIGRSLGVHLILATQKPTGVVNDQIWSNSRFKVCLKVQTAEDSIEILKKDDASKIKEAGRFILQVGNDEIYEMGQSAWAGEKYVPKDVILNKVNDSLDFINTEGTIVKSVSEDNNKEKTKDLGEQLSNIVDFLYKTAVEENIKFNNLWLPAIPEVIYLGNIMKKYSYQASPFKMEGIIGEYDKPGNQEQGLFKLDVSDKNTLVFGSTGSGKELLATSLLYSLCVLHTIQELNVYIIDFGAEVLRPFEKMPHVGNYINNDNIDMLPTLFKFLETQIKKRKELFAEYHGDFNYYNEKSPNKAPLILTILNGYEAFLENCDYDDVLVHLLREGSKYGIVFLLNVVSTNSVRTTTLEYFSHKMILKTSDPYDYQYILSAPNGLIPGSQYGRGIGIVEEEACEFQTAYIADKESVNDTIKATANKYLDYYKARVRSIKKMPKDTTYNSLYKSIKLLTDLPIGYEIESAEPIKYNFANKKITVMSGESILTDISYMGTIIDLIDQMKGVKLNLFDISSAINFEGNATYVNAEFEEPFNELLQNQCTNVTINFIIGVGVAKLLLNDNEFAALKKVLLNANQLANQYFVVVDDASRMNEIEDEDIKSIIDHNNGIYFGEDIDEQTVFNINNINQLDLESHVNNKTFIIVNGNAMTLKGLGVEGEDDD